jgi:murein L,D-transpeptidase YafK
MTFTRRFALLAGAATLAGCAQKSKFRSYYGPEVTRVIVNKGEREMFLLHHRKVLKRYKVELGFAPEGHKQFEGDGRTPEGEYLIDRRNPNSSFHLSLGISYPNEADIAFAKTLGKSPGGDIFIHGEPNALAFLSPDWTAGCISVTNREMEDVYAMIRNGTPITLNA